MSIQVSLEELKWYIMEKPVLRFNRVSTSSPDFQEVLSYRLSSGILGVSRLLLAINPDPNGNYRIQIGTLFFIEDSPLSAVLNIDLSHLDSKVYVGLNPGDIIAVLHRSPRAELITTEAFLEVNEVFWDDSFLRKFKKPVVCETRTALAKYLEGGT